MTRINLVDPMELSDQHLVAEYREIFMVGSALQRSLRSKNGVHGIPNDFTLNKGHVKFFYNKGKYLHERYSKLVDEMKMRGMRPDRSRVFKQHQWPVEYYNDWQPNDNDLALIRERINLRISQKPEWYRKTTYTMTEEDL